MTQVGQRESVLRGQPSCGLLRSLLFSSGPGAQGGWKGFAGNATVEQV